MGMQCCKEQVQPTTVCVLVDKCGTSAACGVDNYRTVDLAVSHFGGGSQWALAGQQAYHTSIVLSGDELWFSNEGIGCEPTPGPRFSMPPSHFGSEKSQTRVFQVGRSKYSGADLLERLCPYFQPGSYDVVHKNCNTFTDCALAFLVSRRLPTQYCALDKMGQSAPDMLLSWASSYRYKANEASKNFNVEAVILKVDPNAWMGTAVPPDRFADAPPTNRRLKESL
eukprot:TRINITY_DN65797_c0_g1_i1.p1 TRINITY_DN65797_c0_g1~~TRINITY_DN65797_c0_g1_i1.p1  ORF type:complete len:225 (+),score=44.19 TRINITY_DN65797_c0_g1_i1:41-715(+)